jgi:two-component system, cell cycle sensor histidine kinase and response regulator CckA
MTKTYFIDAVVSGYDRRRRGSTHRRDNMSETKDPRTTALVVDDEPLMVRLCSTILKSMDIDVVEAYSAAQAMDVLDANAGSIRLLLTDIRMGPGMDGVELSHQVKKTWPHLDIIIMSGFAEEESVKRMLAGSGFPFLPKPFSISAFRETILTTLNAAGMDA